MHFPGKTTLSAAALGAVLVFAWGTAQAADEKDKNSPSAIQQGWAATPIPKEELNLKGKDPAQVALGSYLTFAGDCVGCHSFPRFLRQGGPGSDPTHVGGDPFSPGAAPQQVGTQLKANFNIKHYMAGGRCFGAIQARNLTPDNTLRPRGLTEAEFIGAMLTGEDVSCRTKASDPPRYGPSNEPDGLCTEGLLHRDSPPGYDKNKLMVMPW